MYDSFLTTPYVQDATPLFCLERRHGMNRVPYLVGNSMPHRKDALKIGRVVQGTKDDLQAVETIAWI